MTGGFPYKKVLILGATSGIGRALAEKILQHSRAKVIITGRRKERLDEFVERHGKDGRVTAATLDVTDLKALPEVLQGLFKAHPDIDMVLHNSGISRQVDFLNPASIDLESIDTELTTNYTSIIHVLKYALPHLLSLADNKYETLKNTAFAAVTSQLGMFPLAGSANYCATKAASHSLMMSLRGQLHNTNVKVIEIPPTGVKTELLSPGKEPEEDRPGWMDLEPYAASVWKGLEAGDELICVGTVPELQELEAIRNKIFRRWNGL